MKSRQKQRENRKQKHKEELVFCFDNGKTTVKRWADRSRALSWTDDMKEAARRKRNG